MKSIIQGDTNKSYVLGPGKYCVEEDIVLEYPIEINGEVHIFADSMYSIGFADSFNTNTPAYSAMIAFANDSNLTLGGGAAELIIDGANNSELNYLITSTSEFTLTKNCVIKNANVIYATIHISEGSFLMDGGTIECNNAQTDDYACIYVSAKDNNNKPIVIISGGTIQNNTVNSEDDAASIYNKNGNVTVLQETLSEETRFSYNIVDGKKTITSWTQLSNAINLLSDDTITTEFLIIKNLVATETIESLVPIKISANENITITRGESFTDEFFEIASPFEIAGSESAIITFDGENIEAQAPILNASANISLKYCNFINNINAGSSFDGGVLCAASSSINSINIENCNFNNNSVTGYNMAGGAIAINSTSATSNFVNCSFENNTTMQQGGGAVYISGNTQNCSEKWTTFNNCTFKGNKSYFSDFDYGGAIYVVSGPVSLDSVWMENNIRYAGESDTTGTKSDIYLNGYQQELKINGNINIPTLKIKINSNTPKDIAISDNFNIDSVIENLVLTTGTGSVSSVTQPFNIYTYESIGTEATNEVSALLNENQIHCFTNIVDESSNYYTLNVDGSITAKTGN